MGIENLLAQGVQIRPAGMERNALMQAQDFKDRQQRNALTQMQMDDVHAQRQLAIEQAKQVAAQRARDEQFRQSIPSPQMQASQQALAGGGGPTVGNAAQIRPVDPRLQMLHGAMQAGMGSPMDYINAANPAPMKLGKDDRLLQAGPGGSFRELVGATPAKPEAVQLPPVGQLQKYRDSLPPGDPKRREVQAVIDNQTRPPKYAGGGVPGAAPVPKPEKVLPQAVVKLITEARDNATAMDGLAANFKPEYAGKGVFGLGADMQMGASANLGVDKDSVNWWKDYRKNIELVERHAMFGASLTTGEQGAWRSADISPGMDADVIKRNLATRMALAQKVLGNAEQDMIDAGHSEERVRNIAGRNRQPATPEKPAAAAVQTATNPKTGEKLQLVNGQWVPAK